jgi:hypothetical protein
MIQILVLPPVTAQDFLGGFLKLPALRLSPCSAVPLPAVTGPAGDERASLGI